MTGKDEEGAALLSGVTLTTARVDARVQLDSGAVLRLLPAPTPRWPDLLTVHSDADRMLFSGKVRRQSASLELLLFDVVLSMACHIMSSVRAPATVLRKYRALYGLARKWCSLLADRVTAEDKFWRHSCLHGEASRDRCAAIVE